MTRLEQAGTRRARRFFWRKTLSLRMQVAVAVGLLSFIPNLVVLVVLFAMQGWELAQFSATVWLSLIAWFILVMFVSVVVGYVLSRQLLTPLTRLNEEIEALQARTERLLETQLGEGENEPSEVVAIKASFNELWQQVALEQSRRSAFLATLMHDLRTPLLAANHLLTAIRDDSTIKREERIALVEQLRRENKKLIELVHSMVQAHRFERDGVHLSRTECELAQLVAHVVTRVEPLAAERGVTIRHQGSARVLVDENELERALYNLLSNCVRYARSMIRIEIYAGLIRLSDDGPGLPAPLDELAHPFNAQPVEIAGQRYAAGGGGLGLYIARRIIEAHGGKLTTEFTGPEGTAFLIYLKRL